MTAPEQCTGDEVWYLEMAQAGSAVNGQACEAFGKDCHPIQSGVFQGGQLSFYFTFRSGGIDDGRIDVLLTASGNTLVGTYNSVELARPIPVTLTRIP